MVIDITTYKSHAGPKVKIYPLALPAHTKGPYWPRMPSYSTNLIRPMAQLKFHTWQKEKKTKNQQKNEMTEDHTTARPSG